METYQIVLDIWEAVTNLDEKTLKDNSVTGLIVRVNDMFGGHHLDENFHALWDLAAKFPVRAPYFVYNPWVDGLANFNWLYANYPVGYQGRTFVDVEVRYAQVSPSNYAAQVNNFLNACAQKGWKISIYTGYGYLDLMSEWPKLDYWWARYPYVLYTSSIKTWDVFKYTIDKLVFADADPTHKCPGIVRLWQCTDQITLPGFGNRPVDLNIFKGTLEDLQLWLGADKIVPTLEERLTSLEKWAKTLGY